MAHLRRLAAFAALLTAALPAAVGAQFVTPLSYTATPGQGVAQFGTYNYFDDTGLCWRPLERVTVDEVNHLVVSLTDHFTDMINATVTVPEHPEGESFDPNEIKGIEAADPADQVPRRAPRAPRGSEPTARAHRIPGVVGTAPGPAPGSFPVGSRPCRDVPGALPGTAGAGLGCRCPQRRRPEVP